VTIGVGIGTRRERDSFGRVRGGIGGFINLSMDASGEEPSPARAHLDRNVYRGGFTSSSAEDSTRPIGGYGT